MGILNVTPDSFSDGGEFVTPAAAVDRGLAMVEQGARILDVGGESTRPGAEPVSAAQELERVLPVVRALRQQTDAWISVDTTKPEVMRAVARAGADMINDVTALRAPGALEAVQSAGMAACLMHMQGEPRNMQANPVYADVVADVVAFLAGRRQAALDAGIAEAALCLDPGLGFGKTLAHNLSLMANLHAFDALGAPLLVGMSRKSLFRALLGRDDPLARVPASLAAAGLAVWQGARIVRVHDVRESVDAVSLANAMRRSASGT
ncbi:MAG: dihydropteroate synthase [Salinisphaeraceae bacterium]|nr:dihydropteroate synthase [Salinisphaeraceae bacterium]